MGQCILGMARFARASIGALLVSAVYESTSEQKGNNTFEEKAMLLYAFHCCCQRSDERLVAPMFPVVMEKMYPEMPCSQGIVYG